jgi:pyruvate dehydrogenase E2 component (dihydrolipoamide acetyltransferase)
MGAIASPSVRKLAGDRGIDIDALAVKLRRETIAREDVLGETGAVAADTGQNARYWDVDHSEWGPVRTEPLNRIAQVASANLTAAQQSIPAVTHHDSADMTRIETTRAALKADGIRLTALTFHVAVLARCLREFPRFNASLSSDGASLILKDYVHVGMAVDTPHGLAVPVIRNADKLRLTSIGDTITDLATRARERKLRPQEMGGASMTITNLGGIGGEGFTPIVNPPEVAILGISAQETRPVWDGTGFQPTAMVPLDLSYDHRVVNGADGARFLRKYCALIRHPDDLLT